MEVDIAEALRYLGIGHSPPEDLRRQTAELARMLTARVAPRYVCRIFPLEFGEGGIRLAQTEAVLTGRTAQVMLAQCRQAAVLCCTLGAEFEVLLRARQARDMAQAAILDACGSALVEAGCDAAQEELARRCPQSYFTDRFSPGYGDLPLEVQGPLLDLLDAPRRVGLCATDSHLLTPRKSVTAILGIADGPIEQTKRSCLGCPAQSGCQYRKAGGHCGIS